MVDFSPSPGTAEILGRIASGPPKVDFSPLSDLFDSYQTGVKASRATDAYNALKNMTPVIGADGKPDYNATAMGLLKSGNLDAAKTLAELHATGEHSKLGWAQLAQSKEAAAAANAIAQGHLGLQKSQFENTLSTQTPDYIQRAAEARLAAEEKYAPKTVDIKRPGPFGETISETMMRGPGGIQPLQIQRQPGQEPWNAGASGAPLSTQLAARPTGEEYLSTLHPEDASIVRKVAAHEINPKDLSSKGGHRERIMAAASQFDPDYDEALAPARFAAIKEFNSGGPKSPAAVIGNGNTYIRHLKAASDAGEQLGGTSSLGPLNAPINWLNAEYRAASQDPNLTRYNASTGRAIEEGTSFYRNGGGNEADIQRAIANIKASGSPESRRAGLAMEARLAQEKIDDLQARWRQAVGPTAWNKLKDFPIVRGATVDDLDTLNKRDTAPRNTKPATKAEANALFQAQQQAPGGGPPQPLPQAQTVAGQQMPIMLPPITSKPELDAALSEAQQAIVAGRDPGGVLRLLRARGYNGPLPMPQQQGPQ